MTDAMHDLRTICLDLDDTLWELAPALERAERTVYEWFDVNYPRITERYSIAALRAERATTAAQFPGREHDLPLLRRATFARLAREAGYAEDLAEEAFATFQRVRNQVQPFADVHAGLARLARRAPVVALTNGTADLDAIGLGHYFTAVFTAAGVGAAKPDSRAFLAVCERLALRPTEVVHAGDHPLLDVDAARTAGLHAIWVDRGLHVWPENVRPAEYVVADLHELAELLGA